MDFDTLLAPEGLMKVPTAMLTRPFDFFEPGDFNDDFKIDFGGLGGAAGGIVDDIVLSLFLSIFESE